MAAEMTPVFAKDAAPRMSSNCLIQQHALVVETDC